MGALVIMSVENCPLYGKEMETGSCGVNHAQTTRKLYGLSI